MYSCIQLYDCVISVDYVDKLYATRYAFSKFKKQAMELF